MAYNDEYTVLFAGRHSSCQRRLEGSRAEYPGREIRIAPDYDGGWQVRLYDAPAEVAERADLA